MREAWIALILLAPALSGCLGGAEDTTLGSSSADGFPGVVTTQHPLAAQAGAHVLEQGGNAFDAAAAVQFALNVVEPYFSGIGGGAFMVAYHAETGDIVTLDGRETAPASTTPDTFTTYEADPAHDPTTMGNAVGVPGTLALFDEVVRRYGELNLSTTLEPAIELAEEGHTVDAYTSRMISLFRDRLETWPASARVLLPGSTCADTQAGFALVTTSVPRCAGGEPLQPGDQLIQPQLADTFRLIQGQGPSALYEGEIGQAIVDTVAQREGEMTMSDLEDYEVLDRETIRSSYDGYEIVGLETPSSALVVQQILQLLERYDLSRWDADSAEVLHAFIEAQRLAYQDRWAYMGDSSVVDVPLEGLLAPSYIENRSTLIDLHRANPDPHPGDPWTHEDGNGSQAKARAPPPSGGHTSHFVVVDAEGNVVSVTTTIERAFGTGMRVPGYGFFLNNELTDFSEPGTPNEPGPGKRPLSSMSPTLVLEDGRPVLALGSPGGPTIITTVARVLLGVLEHGQPVASAVDAGRIYAPSYPDVLWENRFPASTLDGLEARGHTLADEPTDLGAVQAAQRLPDGSWTAVADDRRGGGVAYARASPGLAQVVGG